MAQLFDKFPTPNGTFFPLNMVAKADQRQARVKTCYECDHLIGFLCDECGCLVQAKAWLASAKCPLDKWTHDGPD